MDSLTAASELTSAPLLPAAESIDASAIDKNLRAIKQAETSWRLPTLPDEVRLDLASFPGLQHQGLNQFLAGLDRDLHNENDEDPDLFDEQDLQPPLTTVGSYGQFSPLATNGFVEASSLISQLRGQRPTEVLDGDATQRWKLRAIEKGYLQAPQDGIVDGAWSPDLYAVQREMQFAEYDERMRGDRFGAVPLTDTKDRKGLLTVINDWTAPSGLMRMAVDLDLWWDFGQVGKEFSSWGDKWRKVGDSKNPLDFASNLFDAVTGPIDDVVVPIFNMALLWTGVGVGTNFARIGATGVKAVQAAETFNFASRIYQVPKLGSLVGRIFPAALDVGGLAQRSWTAERLIKAGGAAEKVGDALSAWRSWAPVVGTRGVVQTGMRLGVVSQAEKQFLPSYEGASLGDIDGVAKQADRVFRNPWISNVGDVLFTPYNIFGRGALTGTARDLGVGAFNFLGSTAGRGIAGGVIGAGGGALFGDDAGDVVAGAVVGGVGAAGLPFAGRAAQGVGAWDIPVASKLVAKAGTVARFAEWEKLGSDQRMTELFMNAMRGRMSGEEWSKFEAKIGEKGFLAAFADHTGTAPDSAGAAMGFVTLSAALDRTAALQAGAKTGTKGWYDRYYLARNKLVSQLRVFDTNTTPDDLAWAIVSKESRTLRGVKKRFDLYKAEIEADPTKFIAALERHNQQAQLTMRQLLSTDNLPLDGLDDVSRLNMGQLATGARPEDYAAMTEYIATALDSFGDWGKYSSTLDGLTQHVRAGMFADADLAPAISYMGTGGKINVLEAMPEDVPLIKDTDLGLISSHLHDTFFLDKSITAAQAKAAGFYYNPMAREIAPNRARITLMRAESVTKQEYLMAADELKRVEHALKNVGLAQKGLDNAGIPLAQLTELNQNQVAAALRAVGRTGESGQAKAVQSLRRVLIHIRDQGYDITAAPQAAITRYIDDIGRDARWMRYGQAEHIYNDEGRALSGLELLKSRHKELMAAANRTAAEIDTAGLVAKVRASKGEAAAADLQAYIDHVQSQEYRIVYGQEFLMPHELSTVTGIFEDIQTKHLNAMTLGNFFGRKQPQELALKVQRARQRAVARAMNEALGLKGDKALLPTDPKVQYAIDDVYRLVLDPELARNGQLLDDVAHQTFLDKFGTSIRTSGQPRTLQDLGLGKNQERIVRALTSVGWSEQEALAVWRGIKEGRYAEWRDQGLYAIEAKLRGRSQLVDGLKILGGTPNASRLKRAVPGAIAGGLVGGMVGQATAPEGSDGRGRQLLGAIGGAILGGAGRSAAGLVTDKAIHALDTNAWGRYGYMADALAQARDRMRFSLSPFFDASRYTEAWFLGQIGAPTRGPNGERMALPFNQSPKTLAKRLRKELGSESLARQKMADIDAEWTAASRGQFDVSVLEDSQRQFQEIGLLGFNPTAWMKSSFHYLRESGLSAEDAYEAIRKMYTYGTNSRSAFEQSVNFIFFPFSFAKKTAMHAAEWLGDDLTRAVLLHDAYKAYELLDENYDLSEWANEHLPVLEKLKQLNMFAFGLSPGRMGGINAPFVDAAIGNPLAPDPEDRKGLVFNLFGAVGVNVGAGISGDELVSLGKRMVPAINDLNHMIEDLKSQGHVIFDPTHQTEWAQAQDGYAEWSEYKRGVEAALQQVGATMYDLHNNPGLFDLKAEYEKKRTELETKYPGWVSSRMKAMGKTAELTQEKEFRINTVKYLPEEATDTDRQFAQFEVMLNGDEDTGATGLKQVLEQYGITSWEDMPGEQFAYVRGVALEMITQNPGFKMVYDKFYARTFGPITSEVV